jgi:heme/copper-type cytochrome/quinol oxidase subunit 1
VLTALGVALLVTGAVVFATTDPVRPVDFGWYAYAPLSEEQAAYSSTLRIAFDDGRVVWTGGRLVGAGLVVAGLLVLAGLTGWAVGRRAGRVQRTR